MIGRKRHSWRRWTLAVAALAPVVLAGCAGSQEQSGTPTLTWYINPDNGGQKQLAEKCSQQSNGAYTITTQTLPNEADAQREQLVRRLAAADPSIDLMSLDPPFVAEFANAGYLMTITNQDDVKAFTDGVLQGPLKTAYWQGKLVVAPFWANTQLLWYRKSVAQAGGVDPTSPTFTWEQMIKAAEKTNKKVAVQGRRYEGLMVWVNALISSGGGQVLSNADQGDKATPSLEGPAGDQAARIMSGLARSSAAPADISTATEEEARALFQSDSGGFMVNWAYIYSAAQDAVKKGALAQSVVDDIAWTRYPKADTEHNSAPPLGGINLAAGNFTKYPQQALAAMRCITTVQSNAQYMVKTGNPAARAAAYDDPEVRKAFPMADAIRDSIADAGPRPVTPFYGDVSTSVQKKWHPESSVQPGTTPHDTDVYMAQVLAGERLL